MNIVHIVFEFPLPHGSGGDLRNRAVDAGLSHAGATSLISVQAYFRTGKQKLRRKPSYIEADLPRDIIDAIVDEVAKKAPDLVIIDGVFLADIAHRLLSNGYRVIVNMHNIESSLLKETDQARDGWLSGLLHQKRWKPAIIADRLLAAAAERVWVCSADDAFSLESLVGRVARIDIIPNPLPPWCVDAASMPLSGPWAVRALFVGHLGYRPNIQAVKRLLQRIQPAILTDFPDATLVICGRSPGKRMRKLAKNRPGVTLVGDPPSLRSFYSGATVALIPLTEGGGTRLKVLEAMAVGLPVIATAKAVEGLAIVPDHAFLLAETDADFVDALGRLGKDKGLRTKLAENGRKYVFERHSQMTVDQAVCSAVARWKETLGQ